MEVNIAGTGFTPNAMVTVIYNTSPVTVTTTESNAFGSFSATFKVPESKAGEHIITASDNIHTLGVTFFMESTPPAIPALLLPLKTKLQQPFRFDWEDVVDPSGAIYTLQIAKDESFTDITLEKVGLTQSEYTLAGQEELDLIQKEEPYWWRVRAIDRASNIGDWSAVKSFTVGSTFILPDWTKYIFGVLGGLLLCFIVLALIRRKSKAC
jgi:hypothetical protein